MSPYQTYFKDIGIMGLAVQNAAIATSDTVEYGGGYLCSPEGCYTCPGVSGESVHKFRTLVERTGFSQ